MRVVHVVTAFPRHEGDVITPWLGELLTGLRGAGIDARVFAPSYRGGGATIWRDIPVRRFRYAPAALETLTHDETTPDRLRSRPGYAALLPGYLLGGVMAAVRMAASEKPDVIHVHWPVPHALFGAVARAASGGRAALVSSFYSVEIRWVERRLAWAVPFLRWSIESSDVVTAISSSTAEAVGAYTSREVPIIPFSAAVSANRGPEDIEPGREPSGLRLLFVGRLVERKGVSVLIRALARVRDRLDATLTIVGDGPLSAALIDEVRRLGLEDAVELTGRISESELTSRYRESDAFVLPAVVDQKGDTEGLGVVLLEALEFGLPLIASRAGGIPDIVRDGDTGWLVPPGSVEGLAAAILELADDREEGRARASRGLERSRERFALPRVVEDLIGCYRGAMETRRLEGMAAESSS